MAQGSTAGRIAPDTAFVRATVVDAVKGLGHGRFGQCSWSGLIHTDKTTHKNFSFRKSIVLATLHCVSSVSLDHAFTRDSGDDSEGPVRFAIVDKCTQAGLSFGRCADLGDQAKVIGLLLKQTVVLAQSAQHGLDFAAGLRPAFVEAIRSVSYPRGACSVSGRPRLA
ncbi:hypothetical protein D9M69_552090 [compost metagenome]